MAESPCEFQTKLHNDGPMLCSINRYEPCDRSASEEGSCELRKKHYESNHLTMIELNLD